MLTIVKRRRNDMNKAPEEEKMKVGKLFIVVRCPGGQSYCPLMGRLLAWAGLT